MKTKQSTKGTEKWVELGRGGLGMQLAADWCAGDELAGKALRDLTLEAGLVWCEGLNWNVTRGKLMVRVA